MGEMDENEQEVSFGKKYAGNPGDQTGGISGGKGGPNKGSSKAPVPNKGSSKAPVPAKPNQQIRNQLIHNQVQVMGKLHDN